MKKFLKIYKKISGETQNIYNLTNESFSQVICCRASYIFTTFFIILNLSPNLLTFLNFSISVLMGLLIMTGSEKFFDFGIILYFVYRVLDFSDGGVARFNKNSTFFGRFIDGLADIFLNAFFLLALAIFSLKFLNSFTLMFIGTLSAILTTFDSFIYDRYSALVRWSNEENKKKTKPYIKRTFLPKFPKIYNDVFSFSILLLFFLPKSGETFFVVCIIIFCVFLLSFAQNFLTHLFFARNNLGFPAKVKNSAKELKKSKK